MHLNKKILNIIEKDFTKNQQKLVIGTLSSISLENTMNDVVNLENTQCSILKLARGNIQTVITLTAHTKIDFRDIILWASQEKK